MSKIQQADHLRNLIDVASRQRDMNFYHPHDVWGDTPEHQFVDQFVQRAREAVSDHKTIYGDTERVMGTLESFMETPPKFHGTVQHEVHRVLLDGGSIDYMIHGVIDDDAAIDHEFKHGWRNSMMILMFWLHGQQQLNPTLTQLAALYEQHLVDTESRQEHVLRMTLSVHVMAALYSAVQEALTDRPDVPMAWQEPFVVAHLQQEIKNLETLQTVRTVQELRARREAAQVQPEAPAEDDLFRL